MIRVQRPPVARHLAPAERWQLARRQAACRAWENFRRTKTGRAVSLALRAAFRSKCAFCERVNARTVDHFYPKERYPRRKFRWSNLLLCCAECNPAKGDYFPFRNRRPLLLDPTRDEPLEYFTWDLQTGAMVESTDPDRQPHARATRDRLRLDEGPLRDERRAHLNRVVYLLTEVVNEHHAVRPETRRRLEEELDPRRPYLGILRFLFREQNAYRPIVDDARAKLPAIDGWIGRWL
jgi:uncharacterized protein (TIGR02646 family)